MGKKRERGKNKILLTGGHAATTALAVIEKLLEKEKHFWDVYWVGPKYAMEGKRVPTLASIILPKIGVTFYPIISGRIQRKFTKWSILSFLKIPLGFVNAAVLVHKIKPDIILSFGGYAAFPITIVGWMCGVPIVLHDQTYSFNRTNRLTAPFAKKIALSRKQSLQYYPKDKCVITGNPVRDGILKVKPKLRLSDRPTIFITGGSSGAKSINTAVTKILKKLLTDYKVVHQTGFLDYDKHLKIKSNLEKTSAKNYLVYETLNSKQMSEFYEQADIIVSRAGANTVSEIIIIKRPAVLIPLVVGHHDEQKKNAEFAKDFGIASVLDQKDLTSDKLLDEIKSTLKNWYQIIKKVKNKKSPDIGASEKLTKLVEEVIK